MLTNNIMLHSSDLKVQYVVFLKDFVIIMLLFPKCLQLSAQLALF